MRNTVILALLGCSVLLATGSPAAETGFKSLLNGKDLTGWTGDPKLWSVKDGAITGQTTPDNPAKGNTFLIWTGGADATLPGPRPALHSDAPARVGPRIAADRWTNAWFGV